MNETSDHFFRLPESVIHHQILSTLPFKDIVRCSVLSKTWNHIWFNYPNIALALRAHISYRGRPFLDHIEGILEQCLFRKASILKLQLLIKLVSNLEEFAPNMDRWLGAAIERNVSELVLDVCYMRWDAPEIFYSIPERVVVADSLKVLEVTECRFEEDRFTCIKLSHLQKLKLRWCQFVGENVLNNILSGCPALESLEVIYNGSLELYDCVGQIKISSSCLKRLVLSYFCTFPGAIIHSPNLLDLDFIAFGACNLDFKFSSWNVPKLEKVDLKFSVKSFGTLYRAGLEGFLMKLHNYESLKLFIVTRVNGDGHGHGHGRNMILHEKLLAVSFSSLNEFLIKARPDSVVISSRREEHFLKKALFFGRLPVRLSLIFSSHRSIELLYKNLSKACPQNTFQLVSTQEIEHEMDSAWKSFINTHSTDYQTATIIIGTNWKLGTVGRRFAHGWDLDILE